MLDQHITEAARTPAPPIPVLPAASQSSSLRRRLTGLTAVTVILLICFYRPLTALVRFALHSDLYSHVLLIPFVSAYLIALKRSELPFELRPQRGWASVPLLVGLGLIAVISGKLVSGLAPQDLLALWTLAFLFLVLAAGLFFFGKALLQKLVFPISFLVFAVPFPRALESEVKRLLQDGSADAAYALFTLSGMPVFRQGADFHLPGFSLQVAPECSGIHSTLVLLITSLVAGYLFLRSPWKRAVLTLAVIPLALVRNGLRIVTIGQLCVRVSPDMIHSFIHTHGGPVFFALSLVPFFLLLLFLRRSEFKSNRYLSPNHPRE